MRFLYKLLHQNPETRGGVVITTSVLGIIVNILLAALKIIIGAIVSSIAVISEGINNATDSVTSLMTIIGTKLADKRPTAKHPFGYGRIEYLTSLIIAVLIFVTGIELIINSIKLIFNPSDLDVSVITIIVIAISAIVKLLLGSYTIKMGEKVDSGSLVAVGKDCKNDSVVSVVTILSAIIFLVFGLSVDAYAGIITSLFILKAGYEVLSETIANLLGTPVKNELAIKLYKEIRNTPEVINAADMMLHNYGPDKYSGSVNIEIDHNRTIGEIYAIIHKLQLNIMHEYGVVMVFGMYAVDNDNEMIKEMRSHIVKFIRAYDHVKSYHALYIEPDTNKIYCDLIVDYDLSNWDNLRAEFCKYMENHYPDKEVELTIETEFV